MSPPSPRSRSAMTLFSHLDCPRSHAMRFVLALKGLPHDLVYVDPERPPKDLVAAVPGAILPTLMEREVVLYEPRIIAEYLDERFPHPPLLPSDPLGRARTRLTYYRIEQEWLAPLDQIRAGSAAAAARARSELREALIESDSIFNAAKFFLSSEIGLADCLLLPILWRLPAAGIKWRDLGPGIEAYTQRLFNTPLFQRTLSDSERALAES
ncbi:MAG: glutathione S-transferase N-terminal domain-containing protein [Lysobacterales bacterium]|nr:glutathione S-transferase N-terminal domain-containing protein [Xanthomonadales bacterium]MCP5474213.1 glutathione S-transferase N-terminal domain-containing protein [Rhodanobacteraceae bacterium]